MSNMKLSKKTGDDIAGHLVDIDRPIASSQHSNSRYRHCIGHTRYRCWWINPA